MFGNVADICQDREYSFFAGLKGWSGHRAHQRTARGDAEASLALADCSELRSSLGVVLSSHLWGICLRVRQGLVPPTWRRRLATRTGCREARFLPSSLAASHWQACGVESMAGGHPQHVQARAPLEPCVLLLIRIRRMTRAFAAT